MAAAPRCCPDKTHNLIRALAFVALIRALPIWAVVGLLSLGPLSLSLSVSLCCCLFLFHWSPSDEQSVYPKLTKVLQNLDEMWNEICPARLSWKRCLISVFLIKVRKEDVVLHSTRWCRYDFFAPDRRKKWDDYVCLRQLLAPRSPPPPAGDPGHQSAVTRKKSQQGAAALVMRQTETKQGSPVGG